jgi:hypothetical protein
MTFCWGHAMAAALPVNFALWAMLICAVIELAQTFF